MCTVGAIHESPVFAERKGEAQIVGTGVLFKAPSGRELPTESGEGERDRQSWIKAELTQAPSVSDNVLCTFSLCHTSRDGSVTLAV